MRKNYYYKYEWDGSYCYDNSNVLINKLGISDGILLNEAERRITSLRISEILQTPVISKLDDHLKAIHKLLFSDIINVLLSGIITAIDKQTQKGLYRFPPRSITGAVENCSFLVVFIKIVVLKLYG